MEEVKRLGDVRVASRIRFSFLISSRSSSEPSRRGISRHTFTSNCQLPRGIKFAKGFLSYTNPLFYSLNVDVKISLQEIIPSRNNSLSR